MSLLNPTRPELMCDRRGRPYFQWDCDMTLAEFRAQLRSPDRTARAYLTGKLMRQAKPDDVFEFVRVAEIRYLGRSRPFWEWLLGVWERR
jgi:hypothetical protein